MVHLPLRVHPEVLRWVLRRQKNSQPKGRDQGNSKVRFLLSGVRSHGGTPSHTFTFTYSHMSQTLPHFSETFFSKFHLPFHSVLLIPALGLKLLSPEISTRALFLTFLHGSLWKGKDGCQPISPIVCAVHRPPKAVDNASVIVSRLSSCIQLRVLEAAGHIGLLGSLPYTFIGPSPIFKQTAHQISLSEIPPFTVPPTHQVNEKLAKDLLGFMVPTSLVSGISQIDPYTQAYTHMFSCLWALEAYLGNAQ